MVLRLQQVPVVLRYISLLLKCHLSLEEFGVEEENLKLLADSKFMEERANIVSDMLGKNEKMGGNGATRTVTDR